MKKQKKNFKKPVKKTFKNPFTLEYPILNLLKSKEILNELKEINFDKNKHLIQESIQLPNNLKRIQRILN